MLKLYYAPGTCSIAAHIVMEESGEPYEKHKVDLAKGEQRTKEYMEKVHPLGRVPALQLDSGEVITENTAILPYLGKRFGLWPKDAIGESRALSAIGFFAATVHIANSHISRPERYASDPSHFQDLKDVGLKSFHTYLKQIDGMLAGREWLSDAYSVLDPYAFTFYTWGKRRDMPLQELKNYTALRDRMMQRPAVQRVVESENLKA